MNFIICDDKKVILNSVCKIIDSVMMQDETNYKKYVFESYDNNFKKLIEEKIGPKVYILDLEVNEISGLDIARFIRKTDNESVIIFLTSHSEEGYNVLKGDFMCLSFISKLDDYKSHLKRSIKKSIEILKREDSIEFYEKGIFYKIPIKDILYIFRDKNERKCLICTDYNDVYISDTLGSLEERYNCSFLKTSRSCLVNKNRVLKIDFLNKTIEFDSGKVINNISLSYRRNNLWN